MCTFGHCAVGYFCDIKTATNKKSRNILHKLFHVVCVTDLAAGSLNNHANYQN